MASLVRRHELARLRYFVGLIGLIWSGLAIAMTATESLLLTGPGVEALPGAMLLTCTLSLAGALAQAWLTRWLSSLAMLSATLLVSCGVIVSGYWGLSWGNERVALGLFAFYGCSFSWLSAQIFALAAECIDSFSSKRLFPLLAMGCTVGELLGGLVVSLAGSRIKPLSWLLVWAACFALALVWVLCQRDQLARWRESGTAKAAPQSLAALATYVAHTPMARAMAVLLAGMILCQGISQYLFSKIFQASFPRADELAAFLGGLLALTNLAELIIAWWLTPRLVAWLGVPRASLVHPLAMVLSLLVVAFQFSLVPAVLLWISRRTLQDCLGLPVRNLLYNAIPARIRRPLRSFLDGVVISLAQGVAGTTLWMGQNLWPVQLFTGLGVLLALTYTAGALLAGRHYLQTLVGELDREGLKLRPAPEADAATLSPELLEVLPLGELESRLQSDAGVPWAAMNELAWRYDPLARQCLAAALAHPANPVRRAAAGLLAATGEAGLRAVQSYLFSDRYEVVAAALAALGQSGTRWARELLRAQLELRSERAARAWLAAQEVPDHGLEAVFWRETLANHSLQNQRLALQILRWLEGEELLDTLRLSLAGRGGRRSNALEVLSNLGDRRSAHLLVALLEPNSAGERADQLRERLGLPPGGEDWLTWSLHAPDSWVGWAAARQQHGALPRERSRMRQLLALRGFEPLREVDFDDLERVRSQLLLEQFPPGLVLWQTGGEVPRAYLPVRGELVGAGGPLFGGVELLGGFPARSALRSRTPVQALGWRPEVLRQAIQELPTFGTGLFRWLSGQLRALER